MVVGTAPWRAALGQSWDHDYPHLASSLSSCTDILELPDKGFIAIGNASVFTNDQDIFILRIDQDGDTIWSRRMNWPLKEEARTITQCANGGFLVAGTASGIAPVNSRGFLYRINGQGDSLWHKVYDLPNQAQHSFNSSIETVDGGFVATGWADSVGTLNRYWISVIRFNALGDTLWTRKFRPTTVTKGPPLNYSQDEFTSGKIVRELANGDLLVGAQHNSEWQGILLYLGSNGVLNWSGSYGGSGRDWLFDVKETADHGFLLCGAKVDTLSMQGFAYVMKLDSVGDTLAHHILDPLNSINYRQWAASISGDTQMGFRVAGRLQTATGYQPFLMLLNAQGDSIGFHQFPVNISGPDFFPNFTALSNGGLAYWDTKIIGANPTSKAPWILRLDSIQSLYTNRVRGKVFRDENVDCQADSLPFPIPFFIKVSPGPFFVSPDSLGNFSIDLDSGTYTIEPVGPLDYWAATCPANPGIHTVTLTDSMVVDSLDFGLKSDVMCPRLRVDVSTPALRRCQANTYFLTYENEGTEEAQNAYVEVVMDHFLQVDSASQPWDLPQSGRLFTFQLGNVPVGAQGTILIHTTLPCTGTVEGQNHCVRAHIYPDSICGPVNPQWDGSSLQVKADCVDDDTVWFSVENIGQNAMQAGGQVIVLEDNVLRFSNNVQLNAGEDSTFFYLANGNTWHIQASQAPGHPGSSFPATSLEGCGMDSSGAFTIGLVNSFPFDDADFFRSIDCQESFALPASNKKFSFPAGLGVPQWIEGSHELTYRIHFQNTGSGTAHTVTIRDTLDPALDVSTLQPGGASHPYALHVLGGGILKWTFYNIQLPDSTTNPAGSHGFVKYRIAQKPGNPVGTRIENTAAINFDYNLPLRTNTAFNTVGQNFITVALRDPLNPIRLSRIVSYPNPVRDIAHFRLENANTNARWFRIYDLNGRMVYYEHLGKRKHWQVNVSSLPTGLLIYKISSTTQLEATGKIIHQP